MLLPITLAATTIIISTSFSFLLCPPQPGATTDTLTIDATANIGGVEVPWVGIDTDACLYTSCPVSSGSSVDWLMPVDILSEYPAVSISVFLSVLPILNPSILNLKSDS